MIGKIIRSYQDEGGRATLRKIRQRLQGGGHPQSAGKIDLNRIPIMPQLEDIAQADYINHPYQRPAKLDKKQLNIAWVSPPSRKRWRGSHHYFAFREIPPISRTSHYILYLP